MTDRRPPVSGEPPKVIRDELPLRWRIWWSLGFPPIIRVIRLLPMPEWRQEQWIHRVDIWAMDHIGGTS